MMSLVFLGATTMLLAVGRLATTPGPCTTVPLGYPVPIDVVAYRLDGLVVDGMLGPTWFADRVWTFDYPDRRLSYHGTDSIGSVPPQCWVAVGFQRDSAGQRTTNFPRITAVIDGDSAPPASSRYSASTNGTPAIPIGW